MKNWQRVIICVMLIMSVFAMSLSVSAVDSSPTPTMSDQQINEINEDLVSYYLWLTMRAWGINISYNNSLEWQYQVSEQINQWIFEYLDSLPSAYNVSTWIAPWQSNFDYWGNLRFNQSALEDMQDFVDWLVNKLSLSDNDSEVVIHQNYHMGQYILYPLPITVNDNVQRSRYEAEEEAYNTEIYAMFVTYDNYWYPIFISQTYNVVIAVHYYNANDNMTLNRYSRCENANTSNTLFMGVEAGLMDYNERPTVNNFDLEGFYTYDLGIKNNQQWKEWLNQFNDITLSGDSMYVLTNTIMLPDDDPNYTDGDSLIIIGNRPDYEVIEWSGNVTVNNLPAIITQQKIPDVGNDEDNPGFSVPWQAVNGLIQYVAAPAGAIIAIVNEAPVEGVIMLHALIGGIIIFGMIKIMREH